MKIDSLARTAKTRSLSRQRNQRESGEYSAFISFTAVWDNRKNIYRVIVLVYIELSIAARNWKLKWNAGNFDRRKFEKLKRNEIRVISCIRSHFPTTNAKKQTLIIVICNTYYKIVFLLQNIFLKMNILERRNITLRRWEDCRLRFSKQFPTLIAVDFIPTRFACQALNASRVVSFHAVANLRAETEGAGNTS